MICCSGVKRDLKKGIGKVGDDISGNRGEVKNFGVEVFCLLFFFLSSKIYQADDEIIGCFNI